MKTNNLKSLKINHNFSFTSEFKKTVLSCDKKVSAPGSKFGMSF